MIEALARLTVGLLALYLVGWLVVLVAALRSLAWGWWLYISVVVVLVVALSSRWLFGL